MGILEKTDAIDSGVIAWYAEVKGIAPREPAREVQDRLGALVPRLRQLTDMKRLSNPTNGGWLPRGKSWRRSMS
jgi:hypothetical protein